MNKIALITMLILGMLASGCRSDDKAEKAADKNPAPSTSTVTLDLSKAKDGTWVGESSEHKSHGKSKVELTIKDKEIIEVVHSGITKNGEIKDESYGSDKEPSIRKKAEIALKGINSYGNQLQEKKDLGKVDAIAGATVSYSQFQEAVQDAVKKACK